jgi:spore coat protein W
MEKRDIMSDPLKPPNAVPNQVIELLVNNIFKKNGVNIEQAKNNLSPEDKETIKSLVADLKNQVDQFMKNPIETKTEKDTEKK